MFRTIHLMKRRQGMTPQAFRDYYETRHSVLGKAAADGHAISYDRTYLYPMHEDDPAPIYDVMMTLCFPDRAAFEACTGRVAGDPALRDAFVEDELQLFDRTCVATFLADDVSSALPPLLPDEREADGEPFRTIWFGRRRPQDSAAECRTYYENRHRLLGEYAMGGYALNYERHYLLPLVPGAPEPGFTFIMEMNFPSRAAFERMTAAIVGDPALSRLLREDEDRYLDRSQMFCYRGERCHSDMAPLRQVAVASG